MHESEEMLFTFTVIPASGGDEIVEPVSRAVEAIAESGLDYQVTGSCTLVEGTWDEVMPVFEECVHELTEEFDRAYASITVDHHRGESGRLRSSVDAVEETLDRPVARGR